MLDLYINLMYKHMKWGVPQVWDVQAGVGHSLSSPGFEPRCLRWGGGVGARGVPQLSLLLV